MADRTPDQIIASTIWPTSDPDEQEFCLERAARAMSALAAAGYAVVPANGAAADVIAERRLQIEAEGFDHGHDDRYRDGSLAMAAASYAYFSVRSDAYRADVAAASNYSIDPVLRQTWPWATQWWKPTSPRRDLIKAAALILAELERLDRAMLDAAPGAGPAAKIALTDFKAMTNEELAAHIADLNAKWKASRGSGDNDGSRGGSPGEWIAEELDVAKAEVKRRRTTDVAPGAGGR